MDNRQRLAQLGQSCTQAWMGRWQDLQQLPGSLDQALQGELPTLRKWLSELYALHTGWQSLAGEANHLLDDGQPWHWLGLCQEGVPMLDAGQHGTQPDRKASHRGSSVAASTQQAPKTSVNAPSTENAKKQGAFQWEDGSNPSPWPSQQALPVAETQEVGKYQQFPSETEGDEVEEQREIVFRRLDDFAAFVQSPPPPAPKSKLKFDPEQRAFVRQEPIKRDGVHVPEAHPQSPLQPEAHLPQRQDNGSTSVEGRGLNIERQPLPLSVQALPEAAEEITFRGLDDLAGFVNRPAEVDSPPKQRFVDSPRLEALPNQEHATQGEQHPSKHGMSLPTPVPVESPNTWDLLAQQMVEMTGSAPAVSPSSQLSQGLEFPQAQPRRKKVMASQPSPEQVFAPSVLQPQVPSKGPQPKTQERGKEGTEAPAQFHAYPNAEGQHEPQESLPELVLPVWQQSVEAAPRPEDDPFLVYSLMEALQEQLMRDFQRYYGS